MGKNRPGKRPAAADVGKFDVPEAPNYDAKTPVFCLRHLQAGFDVSALDRDGQAAFAVALAKRAQLPWADIAKAPRQGLGSELIPRGQIRASIPPTFRDSGRFMMFRYDGKKPMGGIRVNDVFHVLWIEREFGDLYDHGT